MSQRDRFDVRLNDSPRDRTIAAWLDDMIDKDVNVSEIVKDHFFLLASGQMADLEVVYNKLESIEGLLHAIRSGVVIQAGDPSLQDVDREKAVVSKLRGMQD